MQPSFIQFSHYNNHQSYLNTCEYLIPPSHNPFINSSLSSLFHRKDIQFDKQSYWSPDSPSQQFQQREETSTPIATVTAATTITNYSEAGSSDINHNANQSFSRSKRSLSLSSQNNPPMTPSDASHDLDLLPIPSRLTPSPFGAASTAPSSVISHSSSNAKEIFRNFLFDNSHDPDGGFGSTRSQREKEGRGISRRIWGSVSEGSPGEGSGGFRFPSGSGTISNRNVGSSSSSNHHDTLTPFSFLHHPPPPPPSKPSTSTKHKLFQSISLTKKPNPPTSHCNTSHQKSKSRSKSISSVLSSEAVTQKKEKVEKEVKTLKKKLSSGFGLIGGGSNSNNNSSATGEEGESTKKKRSKSKSISISSPPPLPTATTSFNTKSRKSLIPKDFDLSNIIPIQQQGKLPSHLSIFPSSISSTTSSSSTSSRSNTPTPPTSRPRTLSKPKPNPLDLSLISNVHPSHQHQLVVLNQEDLTNEKAQQFRRDGGEEEGGKVSKMGMKQIVKKKSERILRAMAGGVVGGRD